MAVFRVNAVGVVLVKVSAERIHAWANGEEVIARPPGVVEVVESDA